MIWVFFYLEFNGYCQIALQKNISVYIPTHHCWDYWPFKIFVLIYISLIMSGVVYISFHSIGHFFCLGSTCSYPLTIFFLFCCLSLDFLWVLYKLLYKSALCVMLCIFTIYLLHFIYTIFIVEKFEDSV